jgi:hypothetical protein
MRSLASLGAGLATAILINALAAIAFRWPDVFWSLAWQWGLAARLYVASAVGAFVAARIAPRAPVLHATIAAVPSLMVSYAWWQSEDPLWLAVVIALSGVLGVISGAAFVMRARAPSAP